MIARRLLALLTTMATVLVAHAQPINYAQTNVKIRAGVLLIESQRTPNNEALNAAPHVWSNLELDKDVKPAGWTFENPLGQTTMTANAQLRWTSYGGSETVGRRLDKRTATYWEVSLDRASDSVLSTYDILVLTVRNLLSLNSREREKLRRYIDSGGFLWIDVLPVVLGGRIDIANPAPIPFDISAGGSNTVVSNPTHPLLSFPNPVSLDDLLLMRFNNTGDTIRNIDLSGNAYANTLSWIGPDSNRVEWVAGDPGINPGGATVALGQLGDGYVMITTCGVSATLSSYLSGGSMTLNNTFYPQPPAFGTRFSAAAKLVINAASLTSSYRASAKGSRRNGSSPVDIVPPLLKNIDGPMPIGAIPSGAPPVVFRGKLIASSSTGQVIVMDAKSGRDLDGDGNPDDGQVDLPGSDIDIIWESTALAGPISSPLAVEVPDSQLSAGGKVVTTMVLVRDGNGSVHFFDLEPTTVTGQQSPFLSRNPPDAIVASGVPSAPIAQEGLAIMTDTRQSGGLGRVWILDLATGASPDGTNNWVIQNAPRFSPVSGPATVGYIPILDNSGGVDRVIYVPTSPDNARSAGICSIWLGARGEEPLGLQNEGANLRVQTRASINGIPLFMQTGSNGHSLGVKISLVRANGDPVPFGQLNTYITGAISQPSPGELLVGITGTGDWTKATATTADDVSIRIDYTLDWGKAGQLGGAQSDAYIRGRLFFPDQNPALRTVVGYPALAPNGNLFVVSGYQTPGGNKGGTLFCVREEGRGDFKVLYRWDLFDVITYNFNPGSASADSFRYDPTIVDFDGLTKILPSFLDQPFVGLTFTTGPTIRGNTVYVTAVGAKGFAASSVVLAFDADPLPVEFEVTNMSAGFALAQPDMARSLNRAIPDVTSTLQAGQYTFESDPSPSLLGRIRMSNMAVVGPDGRIRDSISTSLPVILRRSGQPDIVIEPEADISSGVYVPGRARGRWSPLRWYSVFLGFTNTAQPLVTGNTLYMSGSSVLPGLASGGGLIPKGFLQGMNATYSDADPFMFQPVETSTTTDPNRTTKSNMQSWPRPWMKQVRLIIAKPDPGVPDFRQSLFNTGFKWPQFEGIASIEDFRIRILQAALNAPSALGLIGGDGALVTWGGSNIYTFARTDILVADEGRVGRYDPTGNPIWATDATLSSGQDLPAGGTGNRVALSKPTKVYASGEAAYWIVDSGNDRVVRIDNAGRELRTLTGFKVDPNFRPDGMLDNSSLKLRLPRDIVTYTSYEVAANNPFTNARPNEYWIHYVIADTGNSRIVEIVDRYEYNFAQRRILGPVPYIDPNSNKPGQNETGIGVLYWHSPAELSGKQYAYNSIDRIFVPDGMGGTKAVVAFGFGNFEPGRSSFGLDTPTTQLDTSSGFGGIVILDGANTTLITKYTVPAIGAGLLWQDQAGLPGGGSWNSPAQISKERKISGLSSVSLKSTSGGYTVMFTDTTGAYEVTLNGIVQWMMPNEAYRAIRRFDYSSVGGGVDTPTNENPYGVRLTFARRLDSGDILLVNGYYGRTRAVRDSSNVIVTGPFGGGLADARDYFGEVVILDGDGSSLSGQGYNPSVRNLGFTSLSIEFKLPPIKGARQLVSPAFADRR